jgi:hypothetical protein
MAKVKNINGTSDKNCKCGTWLNHWEKFSSQKVNICSEKSCNNKDLVGAHVQKADVSDSSWYIIPLCNSHNKNNGIIETTSGVTLVSANRQQTCEK